MGITTDTTDFTKMSKPLAANGEGGKQVLNVQDFFEIVMAGYNDGAEDDLEADVELARSIIPAGTGAFRDFSYIAPEIPRFKPEQCVGCMT